MTNGDAKNTKSETEKLAWKILVCKRKQNKMKQNKKINQNRIY